MILTPEQFGAISGTANNEEAFRKLAIRANELKVARIEMAPGGLYGVYQIPPAYSMDLWGPNYSSAPDGTKDYAINSLMPFVGMTSLEINWNGATIRPAHNVNPQHTVQGYAGFKYYVHQFTGCSNVTVNDYRGDDVVFTERNPYYGFVGFVIGDGCRNITLNNPTQRFGSSLVTVGRSPGLPRDQRPHNITISNPETYRVFYPIALEKGGDAVEITGARFVDPGRSFVAYNVHNVRADIEVVQGLPGYDDNGIGVITDHAEPLLDNTTSDIRLKYRNVEATVGKGLINYISAHQGTAVSTPGVIRDIHIHLDVELPAAAAGPGVSLLKNDVTGAADTVTRGYVVEDIEWTGRLVGAPSPPWTGDWSGETVQRLGWFKP